VNKPYVLKKKEKEKEKNEANDVLFAA